MLNKFNLIVSLCVLLFASAIVLDNLTRSDANLKRYAMKVEGYLQEQEASLETYFQQNDFIKNQLEKTDKVSLEKDFEILQALSKENFNFCIYQEDSLIFWSNNRILPTKQTIKETGTKRTSQFVELDNGYYEQISQRYVDASTNRDYSVFGLIPIKNKYKVESDYLQNNFAIGTEFPQEIKIVKNSNNPHFGITNKSGQQLFGISTSGAFNDKKQQTGLLILYFLGFLTLAYILNTIAKDIAIKTLPWKGALFLMLFIFGIRILSKIFDTTGHFADLQIFERTFNSSFLGPSLGDLLIDILLLLWIMVFLHKEFRVKTFDHLSRKVRFGLSTMNYFSILLGIFTVVYVLKSLVLDTTIIFDFENVFNLNRYSFIAILSVIMLLVALFLFSHHMMMTIVRTGFSRYDRLACIGVASLVALPIFIYTADSELYLGWYHLLLMSFVYILLFDLFIDNESPNFMWLVVWLVVFSAFPSILLFKYNSDKDIKKRKNFALTLAEKEDQEAQSRLIKFRSSILYDSTFISLAKPPFPRKVTSDKLRDYIDTYFKQDSYLFNNYMYNVYAFHSKYKSPAVEKQIQTYDFLVNKIQIGQGEPLQRFWHYSGDNSKLNYIMPVNIQDEENPVTVFFEFQRKRKEKSKVYTELLVDRQYRDLDGLNKYDFAIYDNKQLFDHEGKGLASMVNEQELPPPGDFIEKRNKGKSEVIYQSTNNTAVVISKELSGMIAFKIVSLFSYLFGILILIILSITVVNSYVKILPDTLGFSLSRKSLRNRIQFSVIGLSLVSFIIIGVVTFWFFRTSSEEYHEARLERKTRSVLTDAIHELDLLIATTSDSAKLNLAQIVNPLSAIHRMDLNLFSLDGNLIYSSESDIYDKGILSTKMEPQAFYALSKLFSPSFKSEAEMVGTLTYKSNYVPLKNQFSETVAYLGLPYYSKQRKLRSDVTDFMGTLLNVYVFLMLIAGAIAAYVANSITKPISSIGDKLKTFKLGRRNEPLEWTSNDEVGDLINEYNRLIKKVEESAELLAQSEREGAWREMAKQVAHEIKNPLTPMKLSIQYLQHAIRSNPANIQDMIKRVSATLIEQIDNLAHIATEFSNFAKMPRADNKKIILNKLVSSVFDLFNENLVSELDLKLDIPKDQFVVYADKNQLMRVLTNLIKNAEQAIPENRPGQITVSLDQVDGKALIKVSDNGTGISDDKKDKVFVPNFTTKNSGTGLGLAISRNIIEAIKGKIYFETKVNIGTDFFVSLPIEEVLTPEEVKEYY